MTGLVDLQIDLYWTAARGADPVTYLDGDREELIGTKVTDQPVVLERDSTKRGYLHPVAGSDAGEVGAGLFAKRG